MKKFVVGIIVGVALTVSVTAAADSVSLLGKKITSETEVYLDGKLFDTAPVVDGTSLAPLRKAYETAGYKVTYKERKVYLESPEKGVESVTGTIPAPTPVQVETPDVVDPKFIEMQIGKTAVEIQTQRIISNPENGFSKEEQEDAKKKIPELETKLKELKEKLAEVEATQ